VVQVASELLELVRSDSSARVGGTRSFYPVKVSEGMFSGASMVRVSGLSVDSRAENIRCWFAAKGFFMSDECLGELWLVTRAAMHFSVTEVTAKRHVAMFAHLGDRVLAVLMSLRCLSAMVSSADCAGYSAQFKNEILAEYLHKSGMRDLCEVQGLSINSKGNADIFEAVIGVLSTYYSFNNLLSFVNVLGFSLPAVVTVTVDDMTPEVPGLNSTQYQRALQLVAEGKL
jgi:hypothetical protein